MARDWSKETYEGVRHAKCGTRTKQTWSGKCVACYAARNEAAKKERAAIVDIKRRFKAMPSEQQQAFLRQLLTWGTA